MRLILALVCCLLISHNLVGEPSPNAGPGPTKWAYSDSRGCFKELTLNPDGSVIVKFISTTYRVNPKNPSGWGIVCYELKSEVAGSWEEKKDSVILKIERPNDWLVPQGTHPLDTYVGTLQAGVMNGKVTVHPTYGWSWTATEITPVTEQENRPPRVLVADQPHYPRIETFFTEKKINGSATVRITVTATGDVSDVSVVNMTRKEFGESAVQAVKFWKFLPRINNGSAVDSSVEMKINFTMKE